MVKRAAGKPLAERSITSGGTRFSLDYKRVLCSKPSCKASRLHNAWGAIRAAENGWFAERSGANWCPKHNPDWVAAWRVKKAKQADGR